MSVQPSETVKVWDPLVRIFHWSLVLAFFIALVTGDDWLSPHVVAGYTVTFLLVFRLLWGLVGTRHARFSDFVFGPSRVLGYLKEILTLHPRRYLGHNPAGGAMIIALLVLLVLTTLTGMATYGAKEAAGPLADWLMNSSSFFAHALKEVHEFCAYFTLTLVGVHVGGVVLESLLHRENLIRAMFTGRKKPLEGHEA